MQPSMSLNLSSKQNNMITKVNNACPDLTDQFEGDCDDDTVEYSNLMDETAPPKFVHDSSLSMIKMPAIDKNERFLSR